MKFHHLGIACENLEEAARALEAQGLGRPVGAPVWDEHQQAHLQMLTDADGIRLELVQGPRVAALAKRGTVLYHVCYTVPDLDAAFKAQLDAGALPVMEPAPAPLFQGRRAAFVRGNAGLLELLEEEPPSSRMTPP